MVEFDPGPPTAFANHFAGLPDLSAYKAFYWYAWGPIFYRGRLDGSARLIGVASDPGPTERVAGRTLVGDAGQRVQGFLAKLGLTRGYVLVNAHPLALFPSHGPDGLALLQSDAALKTWRNAFYDLLLHTGAQAIVAFGDQAQKAVDLWPGKGSTPVFKVPHPSNHSTSAILNGWRAALPQLRSIVTPDADGTNTGPNYGTSFTEADYARVPPRDLPWGLPSFVGDDAWGRKAKPKHNDSVSRPGNNLRQALLWLAPKA